MNSTLAAWLQFLFLVAALAACYVPLGNYIAKVFTDGLARVAPGAGALGCSGQTHSASRSR